MDEARKQLAEDMDARRQELRLRWTQVARRAGMTPQNLLRIRAGEIAVTDFAAYGLEEALEWPHGHVAARLESGDPARAALRRAHQMYVERYGLEKADEMISRDVQEINEAQANSDDESDAG